MLRRNAAVTMRDAVMMDAAIAMMDVGAKAETATTTRRPGAVKENDAAKTDAGHLLAEEITSVTLQARHHHHLRLAEAEEEVAEEVAEEDPQIRKAKGLAQERTTTKLVQVNLRQAMTQRHQSRKLHRLP